MKIAFVSTAVLRLIPDLIQHLKRIHPAIRLQLREAEAARQVEGLLSGEFDLSFMHATGLHAGLEYHQAESSTIQLALPAKHPLARASSISLRDLRNETLVLPAKTQHKDLYDLVMELCKGGGLVPKAWQEVTFLQTALPLIAAGAGCAFLPDVFKRLRPRSVAFRKIAGIRPHLPLYAVTKRVGMTRLVRNVLKQVVRDERSL